MIMKVKYNDEDEYWSVSNLLSHNCEINICSSIRNLGKSYSAKQMIKRHIENGNCAVWSRWEIGELSLAEADFFPLGKMTEGWIRNKIENTPIIYYHNEETGGRLYFIPLKSAMDIKGIDLPNLTWWVYDEFLPEFYKVQTRKIIECKYWLSMYRTLKRNNPNFRCLLISNMVTWFSAFHAHWKIKPFPSGEIRFFNNHHVAYENVQATKAQLERIMITEEVLGYDPDEYAYNVLNQSKDPMDLICECPNKTVPLHCEQFVLYGHYYTWRMYNGLYYWVETKKRSEVITWTFNRKEVSGDVRRASDAHTDFEDGYDNGVFRFETGIVQDAFFNMMFEARKRI
jgi:hypothetical protein